MKTRIPIETWLEQYEAVPVRLSPAWAAGSLRTSLGARIATFAESVASFQLTLRVRPSSGTPARTDLLRKACRPPR